MYFNICVTLNAPTKEFILFILLSFIFQKTKTDSGKIFRCRNVNTIHMKSDCPKISTFKASVKKAGALFMRKIRNRPH